MGNAGRWRLSRRVVGRVGWVGRVGRVGWCGEVGLGKGGNDFEGQWQGAVGLEVIEGAVEKDAAKGGSFDAGGGLEGA